MILIDQVRYSFVNFFYSNCELLLKYKPLVRSDTKVACTCPRWKSSDIIIMLKRHHHDMLQLSVFEYFCQRFFFKNHYVEFNDERKFNVCVRIGEEKTSLRITVLHHETCLMRTHGAPKRVGFLSHPDTHARFL